MKTPEKQQLAVGLVGLQDHGLTDRSLALDILASLVQRANHELAFVMDASFDSLDNIFKTIQEVEQLDLLAVSLRPESGVLVQRLKTALANRELLGFSKPYLVLGGQTAQCAPDLLQDMLPDALIFAQDAEAVFPNTLKVLSSRPIGNRDTIMQAIIGMTTVSFFQRPVHLSTQRAISSGGTVWVESSRGCRLNCAFCGLSNEKVASNWRLRDFNELFDELEYINKNWGITTFSLADYSAFESDDSIKSFLTLMKKRNLSISFRCDMRLGTAEHIKSYLPDLRNAGLKQVFVGIESVVSSEQKIYGKPHKGSEVIRYLESAGIRVIGGFITLQPLATRDELYQQVIGLREYGILNLISTPLKTIRIYRGTRYEQVCRSKGVLGKLNPDMLTYQYQCLDPYVDIVRQVIQFFDTTLKKVYFNNYVENMLRLNETEDIKQGLEILSGISKRVQETDYWLLHELSKSILEDKSISYAREKAISIGIAFNDRRKKCFKSMAQDYEILLESGFPYYREDFETFIGKYESIEDFQPSF